MRNFNLSNNQTFPCSRILTNPDILHAIPESLFDYQQHRDKGKFLDSGRGTVVMFNYMGKDLVLKTYHRGGLPGRFVRESYFYSGVHKTRMWQEFHMLVRLHAMGMPVPRPVAARCELHSPFIYRGQLLMEQISGATTLADLIRNTSLPDDTWSRIGDTIARFHQQGICHNDLNASNILLTSDESIYLIDFDKCFADPASAGKTNGWPHWFEANLRRLKRSLIKHADKFQPFHFDNHKWQQLRRGYDNCRNHLVQCALALGLGLELLPMLSRMA